MKHALRLNDRRSFLAGASAATLLISHGRLFAAPPDRMLKVYVTAGAKRHQAEADVRFGTTSAAGSAGDELVVDATVSYQPMLGFGAALTDASCYLLSQMEPAARHKFLTETYSPDAMALNTGRVAIGSSDYSRELFNYDDTPGDTELKHFSIAHDEAYVLPMLREVRAANPALFLLATPWSPPGWMKTYGSMKGGWMSAPYLEPYAHYFVKYLEAYAKAGVRIDAITSQNELETDQNGSMPATYWTPDMEQDFVRDHLGPLLRKQKLDTQIWLLDHNYDLWKRVRWQLRDTRLRPFVAGVAWHGYVGTPDLMSRLHDEVPDVPFYWTEGGPDVNEPKYATEWTRWGRTFTEAIRNWCRGLTTWNLMLDPAGNPNIGPFQCGGLVTLKPDGTIVESGQYWALRHFSQHVRRQAVRVASHTDASELMHVAFRNPDGGHVMVLTNTGGERMVRVRHGNETAGVSLAANSVTTLTW